jgi:hypothetical protein
MQRPVAALVLQLSLNPNVLQIKPQISDATQTDRVLKQTGH